MKRATIARGPPRMLCMLCTLHMLCMLCTQVTEEALDVLLEYQQQMERVRSDRKHKFALARTFVLPGRCASGARRV